jgi:hypothetical protein
MLPWEGEKENPIYMLPGKERRTCNLNGRSVILSLELLKVEITHASRYTVNGKNSVASAVLAFGTPGSHLCGDAGFVRL